MKYGIVYDARKWIPQFAVMSHRCVGEWQVIEQDLGNGLRLYVELCRFPETPLRVAVARIDGPFVTSSGATRRHTVKFLQPDDLELIEASEEA